MSGSNQMLGAIQRQYHDLPLPVRPIEFSTDSVREEKFNWTCADDDELELGRILTGFLDKMDEKSHEALNKFVSRFNKDVPVEEILHQHQDQGKENKPSMMARVKRKVKNYSSEGYYYEGSTTATRDVINRDFQTSSEEEERMERFKVKTVNIAGVGPVHEEEEEEQRPN